MENAEERVERAWDRSQAAFSVPPGETFGEPV
jgi:hypothetical protein